MHLRLIDLICVSALLPLFSFLWFLLPAAIDSKASNLSSLSKKYRSDAKYLNTRSTYAKLAAGGVFFIMLIVYVRFWWLWEREREKREEGEDGEEEEERKEVLRWKTSCTESADEKLSPSTRKKQQKK